MDNQSFDESIELPEKKGRSLFKIVSFAIVAIIVVGVLAVVVFGFDRENPQLIRPTFNEVMANTFENLASTRSFSFIGDSAITLNNFVFFGGDPFSLKLTLSGEGQLDFRTENYKGNITLSPLLSIGEESIYKDEGNFIGADIGTKLFEETLYFSIQDIRQGISAKKLQESKLGEFEDMIKAAEETLERVNGLWGYTELETDKADFDPLTLLSLTYGIDIQSDELKAIIAEATEKLHIEDYLTLIKEHEEETEADITLYPYTLSVNSKLLTEDLIRIADSISERNENIQKEDIIEFREYAEREFEKESYKDPEFTLWIDAEKLVPVKIHQEETRNDIFGDDGSLHIETTFSFKDFNQPFSVDLPENTLPLQEYMQRLWNIDKDLFNDAETFDTQDENYADLYPNELKEADAEKKILLNNLRVEAVLYYDDNQSYESVCSSTPFLEASNNVKDTSISCRAGGPYWISSVKLKTSGYYCVDSTGFANTVDQKPLNTRCVVD